MKLLVQELSTEIFQTFSHSEVTNVRNFQVHILRFGAPTGSLKVQLRDESGELIEESASVAISTIGTDDYFHGYVKFDLIAQLKADTTYQLALVPLGGYSFSEPAWIGWCNGFDLGRYPAAYTPRGGINAPLDFAVWGFKQVFKGV